MIDKIRYFLLVLAAAAVAGGEYLELRCSTWSGVAIFGFLGLIAGVLIMKTGLVRAAAPGMDRFHGETPQTERHPGLRARFIGVVVLVGSALMVAGAVMEATHAGRVASFTAAHGTSPVLWGVITLVTGALVTLMGAVRVWGGTGAAPGAFSRVVEWEFRVVGVFTAIAGVALLALGIGLLLSPDSLRDALAWVTGSIAARLPR